MNKPFKKIKIDGGWRVEYDPACCGDGLLKEIESGLSGSGARGAWSTLEGSSNAKLWCFENSGKRYVLKLYLPRSRFESVKARVKNTRGQRAWEAGQRLCESGILTPEMPAWGVRIKGGLPEKNFLLTGFVPDATGLYTLLSGPVKAMQAKDGFKIRRSLMAGLGQAVSRLHASGIVHGDLRLDNILVKDWDTDEPLFYFIDNERNTMFDGSAIPEDLIIKNLVQLNMIKLDLLTRTDRARFFKAYRAGFRPGGGGFSPLKLARSVWQATESRMMKRHGGLGK